MTPEDLKKRTKEFGINTLRLAEKIPETMPGRVLGQQLIRSGTSVGANYRSACRARSKPDFIAKLGIVAEEADESIYWMELLVEAGLLSQEQASQPAREAHEIVAIVVSSINTARKDRKPAVLSNHQSPITNHQ
jgi:four helix bundle protein